MSDSHTSQQRQYPPRSRSALVITALKKYQQKLRPKFSNFAVRPLYDRFRDKVVDRTRAADETRRGHEPPTSSIGRDPYDEESPHPSLTISAEPSHLPSSFGDPRALSSSRTLLNSITSTCIGVHGSVNSDSRSGSSISIDRRNCLRTKILVRLPEDRPDHALLMIASLDTQCWGADLMALRQFERLNKDNRIVLHPVDAVIEPLKGPPVRVVGIARGLTWTLEEGYRTYTIFSSTSCCTRGPIWVTTRGGLRRKLRQGDNGSNAGIVMTKERVKKVFIICIREQHVWMVHFVTVLRRIRLGVYQAGHRGAVLIG